MPSSQVKVRREALALELDTTQITDCRKQSSSLKIFESHDVAKVRKRQKLIDCKYKIQIHNFLSIIKTLGLFTYSEKPQESECNL